MNVKISLIEDRGYSKTLHFHTVGDNKCKGYVTIREGHEWFNKECGDDLFLNDVP